MSAHIRRVGHGDVHPVTPTGLGERVHLANERVGLETHVSDVVNPLGQARSAAPAASKRITSTVRGARHATAVRDVHHAARAGTLPAAGRAQDRDPLQPRRDRPRHASRLVARTTRVDVFADPDWELRELPTCHWPMFWMPEALADLLHRIASTPAASASKSHAGDARNASVATVEARRRGHRGG